MPTPDKTMDDVSKLVAEARATCGNPPCYPTRDKWIVSLADALESVAKELREAKRDDEEHYQRSLSWKAKYQTTESQLATVAKERDALRERVDYLRDFIDPEADPPKRTARQMLAFDDSLAAQSKP
jgi:chromosome segregation ATPase